MNRFRVLGSTILLAAGTIVAACSDSTGPRDVELNDVLADVQMGQSFAASGLEFAGGPALPQASAIRDDNCAFNGSTGMFACPSTTVNGITFTRSFQLLDANGAPQASYSSSSTAAVRVVNDVSGRITSTTSGTTTTIDIVSHDDHTLSGLLSGTYKLNGQGSGSAEINGGGLNHDLTTSHTISDLELPRHDSDVRYPRSGTVTAEAVLSAPNFRNTSTATLTFDGSSKATLVFTTFGITRTCKIDLVNKSAAPACS